MTSHDEMLTRMDQLLNNKYTIKRKLVPGRLQAAIALLERLREYPSLDLNDQLSRSGNALIQHETYGDMAHNRLSIDTIVQDHGRCGSRIAEWGIELLKILGAAGFLIANEVTRKSMIQDLQSVIVSKLESEYTDRNLV